MKKFIVPALAALALSACADSTPEAPATDMATEPAMTEPMPTETAPVATDTAAAATDTAAAPAPTDTATPM